MFLSQRRGALLFGIRPTPAADNEVPAVPAFEVTGLLRFADADGGQIEQPFAARYDGTPVDERGNYAEQPGVAKTVALALLVSGMQEAATQYAENQDEAIATMRGVHERIEGDAAGLEDDTLSDEVSLAAALLALMEEGAPQGDLSPY
ncbi:hypothetical protein Hoch_2998 [Haliangium ochraceum DSM 14365]|uniref:Uncharacterized protein n=1 Tax=Haliangium ochraceum (strain DSM 14365 / JCM 11303 / SMP-2) TaxID=502025 RepID=D0LQZ7_HALO1|nr:hypothetical protein Hoch_2998 [Haliangium ochraceum DSM 14365]